MKTRPTIRVLSVQHYPQFGGPHNEILRLEPALNERGFETVVALTDFPGTAFDRLNESVETHRIPLQRFRRPQAVRANLDNLRFFRRDVASIRSIIRRNNIDIVKVHGAHNPQGAVAAVLENRPLVWVLSSDRPPKIFRKVGSSYVNRYADVLLVTGKRMLDAYSISSDLRERSYSYFPPVDTDVFRVRTSDDIRSLRAKLDIIPSCPLIGTISNVNPQKGLDYFVKAAGIIRHSIPNAQFIVVGGVNPSQHSYYETLRKELSRLGLDGSQFRFLGSRNDIQDILPTFDIKVIASRAEGVPTTAGEAMACGVPVVATDVGSMNEVIEEGISGNIVPPARPDALATAVVSILGNPDKRQLMSESARIAAVRRFSLVTSADVHAAAYSAAIARRDCH